MIVWITIPLIVGLYIFIFINEANTRNTYSIRQAEITAMVVFGLGLLFNLTGVIFAWQYVDYNYVSKDE